MSGWGTSYLWGWVGCFVGVVLNALNGNLWAMVWATIALIWCSVAWLTQAMRKAGE